MRLIGDHKSLTKMLLDKETKKCYTIIPPSLPQMIYIYKLIIVYECLLVDMLLNMLSRLHSINYNISDSSMYADLYNDISLPST